MKSTNLPGTACFVDLLSESQERRTFSHPQLDVKCCVQRRHVKDNLPSCESSNAMETIVFIEIFTPRVSDLYPRNV